MRGAKDHNETSVELRMRLSNKEDSLPHGVLIDPLLSINHLRVKKVRVFRAWFSQQRVHG